MEHLNLYIAELTGTAIFMVLGLGVCANISLSKSGMCGAGGIVAALGWGVSMVTVAVCFGPVSGAHCNPAVTIGFWAAGSLSGKLVPGYILSQCVGAAIGALIVWQLYKDHLDAEGNPDVTLGVFATGPSICNSMRNCMSEAAATFCLMFVLLSLGHQEPANGVAMFFVFCGVAGGVMSFGGLTGYAINPARDLMPRLVYSLVPIKNKGGANWRYAWIPVVGPLTGAFLAAVLYKVIFL